MILMDKIASRFLYGVLAYGALVLLYAVAYFIWEQYIKVLFKRNGQDAVATIIGIEVGGARYDVKYNGKYYRNWIPLNRKRLRSVKIGERYHARVLPDKLPQYVKIILVPLPPCEQDINGEVNRIIMMYGNK